MSFVRSYRRSLLVAVAWIGAVAALLHPTGASGQAAVDPGLGSAYAQGVKVDPRSGRLSFGITYGMALAGHQNKVSRAEAHSVDLGLIGSTLAGEACDGGDPTLPEEDQPHPLSVSSTDEGASAGRSEPENGAERYVQAKDVPYAIARSVTTGAGEAGVIELGSTVAEAESGIIDGARRAIGRTDVGSISLGGGAVKLRGLHWEASHTSAPEEKLEGSFTMEALEVQGQKVSLPAGDVTGQLNAANAALAPMGLELVPPQVRQAEGIVFVDPLRISIVPSTTRDGITGKILSTIQPQRESLFDALIARDCGNAAYITVFDIVIGSITGAGSLGLEVGGVTATSSEISLFQFPPGGLGLAPLPPPTPLGGSSPLPGLSASGGTAAPTSGSATSVAAEPTATTQPVSDETALPEVEEMSGTRGGPLVLVGLTGLLLLGALAEADRRKMRRAQRQLPMDAFG